MLRDFGYQLDYAIVDEQCGTYFNELTKGNKEGAFVDCGSYDGESAIDYMKFIGKECQVYAFEPDKDNYQNILNKMKDKKISFV